jgi:hypothetical protein
MSNGIPAETSKDLLILIFPSLLLKVFTYKVST